MMINLHVKRFNPDLNTKPYVDTFDLDIPSEERWTALDLLNYVYTHIDRSLRYPGHSICNRGICRCCLAKVGGKVHRLCDYVIEKDGDIFVEPVNDSRVVIDLVST